MPSTTYRDRHGHPGSGGFMAGHLLFAAAGAWGLTIEPSQSIAAVLDDAAVWTLKLWALGYVIAGIGGAICRLYGRPRTEITMLRLAAGLTALWAIAVVIESPPSIMLALALAAWCGFAHGATRAAVYRLDAGIDQVERLLRRRRHEEDATKGADRGADSLDR